MDSWICIQNIVIHSWPNHTYIDLMLSTIIVIFPLFFIRLMLLKVRHGSSCYSLLRGWGSWFVQLQKKVIQHKNSQQLHSKQVVYFGLSPFRVTTTTITCLAMHLELNLYLLLWQGTTQCNKNSRQKWLHRTGHFEGLTNYLRIH